MNQSPRPGAPPSFVVPRLYPKLPSYDQVVARRHNVRQSLGTAASEEKVNEMMEQIYPDPRGLSTTAVALQNARMSAPLSSRALSDFRRANARNASTSTVAQQAAALAMRGTSKK